MAMNQHIHLTPEVKWLVSFLIALGFLVVILLLVIAGLLYSIASSGVRVRQEQDAMVMTGWSGQSKYRKEH